MYDIHVILSNSPGSLGAMGMALGNNGVGLEGGGVFTTPDAGHAHFLVEDGETARRVLTGGRLYGQQCMPSSDTKVTSGTTRGTGRHRRHPGP
ncbi:ACT domain-containing protein [Klebsiella pneumoniae]|uniref:ACT domain-containing protein n=1 Tax=Klebsiella pneumoniae TaxID=573 RepID=A0A447S5X8_KLEPN|nr:ACT domain-containing protein [Klebsiella pneumoniae]